jgi:hypothetical protein
MDYVPPDGPLPDAESLLGDSDDEMSSANESAAAGGMNGGTSSVLTEDSRGVKYSRLRLILQAPETIKA